MDTCSDETPFLTDHTPPRSQIGSSWKSVWLCTCLTVSILCNVISIVKINSLSDYWSQNSFCASRAERYESPLLDQLDIQFSTVHFNGSFLKETIYRRRPSPEVDAAWTDLGADLEGFIVAESEGARYGLQPGMVKRLEAQGGGYVVQSEGMHHLHCLNLLRQSSHFNYGYYRGLAQGAFVNEDDILEKHIGHCVDILRQQLMCTFDTSVFGQWWVEEVGPFVDFNTQHLCKNFDVMRDWVRDHQISHDGTDLVEFRKGDTMLATIP